MCSSINCDMSPPPPPSPLSLSSTLWNLQWHVSLSRCVAYGEPYKGWKSGRTTCQMMQLCRKGKKWTLLLCHFKFRNGREERDNSRAFRRQNYSRGKGGEGGAGDVCLPYMFRTVLMLQSAPTQFALTCTVWIWKLGLCGTARLCEHPGPPWVLCAARLLLRYLIMKNDSLGPRRIFTKQSQLLGIQIANPVLDRTEREMERLTERLEKKKKKKSDR